MTPFFSKSGIAFINFGVKNNLANCPEVVLVRNLIQYKRILSNIMLVVDF